MKVKKIERKLNLSKETVVNLDNQDLKEVVGGATNVWCSYARSCDPCLTITDCLTCSVC